MLNNNLADINFWNEGYKNYNLTEEEMHHPVVNKIYQYFENKTNSNTKKVFEIGCYPGRFIYHFGKLGFNLNGIDRVDYLDKMVNWLKSYNFSTGDFFIKDVFEFETTEKYDVVFSSGFIEHFKNFEEVIKIHAKLVERNGYIFITTPNFSGFIQKFLHTIFDRANLRAHYLPAMNPALWKNVLEKENFKILDMGYTGGFDFWSANKNIISRICVKIIRTIFCWKFLPNIRAYSPDIFILAKKK